MRKTAMQPDAKIYVAGHNGLVGSAIVQCLLKQGYTNLITRSHSELDLTQQHAVASFFASEQPEYVFLAAAKVGGIAANNHYRAEFIYENLMIQSNVIHQSYLHQVKKLLFLGSTCIYPKAAPQPISEHSLLTGALEYTNEPYAIAKIAGLKMCESYNLQYATNYLAVMPTNLYGPNDNFDLDQSHVLPALIRKIFLARALENHDWAFIKRDLHRRPLHHITATDSQQEILSALQQYGISLIDKHHAQVEIWGTGQARREFLWSEDMAEACLFIMQQCDFSDCFIPEHSSHINIGTGIDISISELASKIKNLLGLRGNLIFNAQKPDGTLRKLSNPDKLHKLGWQHKIALQQGLTKLCHWYKNSLL